tara:strand:- start:193 stop:1293 length:1101 start_codon:yes stop_codon:yes gene_type:complete
MSKSHYIIEDVQSIYASIQEETDSVEEINNFAGDVYAAVATSMLHEGYSASGILGFLSTASDEEILERFGDYDENFIAESTISEEYVNEQVEQLDEFVGAALRVLGAGAKAAKFAQGAKGLAPLSRIGQGLQGAGRAMSRVAKQGPGASSVVRSGLSKLRSAAGAGLGKLKAGASKIGGALKGAAKTLIPGAVGFAAGRMSAPKAEAPKASQPAAEAPPSTSAAAPPKPAAPKPNPNVATSPKTGEKTTFQRRLPTMKELRAAQAARAQAKAAGESKGEAEYQAVKAGVGAGKPPAAKPKAAGGPGGYQLPAGAKPKTVEAVKKESYDVVLDYLLSEGHAETVEEAHYIMLRLEADHIQEIVETAS